MAEAIVALGGRKRVLGRLRFETDGRRQHSQFEYADEWLAAKDRFALSPGLPLRGGGHYSSGKDDKRSSLPECFSDAAPDAWGRALMTKALGGGLSEYDYLVRSDDRTRQGALRFLGEDMEPLSDLAPTIPRLVELERLRSLAQRFERDPGGAEEEARDLAGVAGSLGGARPKASVEGDGHLWIAKFTSAEDTRAVERAEVATLKLAERCGLRVAEASLVLRDSDSPIALIRRFDRRGDARIPYISARSALDWQSDEGGFYTDIADVIRWISSKPVEDLHELWRRIVFTILVSNRDDHLKNHGFIYAGDDRWRLSPAFDINPSPSRHRVLETGIIQGGSFEASVELALEACEFFDVNPEAARQQAVEMARMIAGNWKQGLRAQGASGDDVRGYAEAFEHAEAEKALRLDG
ncbi:MAG: type II toxin-antitoxin system HipA family toxin [Gammaproteobacteria bacterium]|nr:type II toxin-antitoxin system HipA family toxin [Gammaproteobacteria bacterium]MDE0716006.1 type II toxin-antitoxin system HipA family toxin [Gammaproteobacteria bacterium]MXY65883.1 type II toxin-antitoxin system HipA family toxin [Gammaproteobacteria bacterium]MYG67713.1 type II toxin-antitoxin system HipA family toxin [Gammaproteobacteria bacterium]MYH89897.1 type II toxin-antitoxin system HipA family toxin [Gammaproteobacteria bacterium]